MPAIYSILLLVAPQAAQIGDGLQALQTAQIAAEQKLRYDLEECQRSTRFQYGRAYHGSNSGSILSSANREQENCARRAKSRYQRSLASAVRQLTRANAEAEPKAKAEGR